MRKLQLAILMNTIGLECHTVGSAAIIIRDYLYTEPNSTLSIPFYTVMWMLPAYGGPEPYEDLPQSRFIITEVDLDKLQFPYLQELEKSTAALYPQS